MTYLRRSQFYRKQVLITDTIYFINVLIVVFGYFNDIILQQAFGEGIMEVLVLEGIGRFDGYEEHRIKIALHFLNGLVISIGRFKDRVTLFYSVGVIRHHFNTAPKHKSPLFDGNEPNILLRCKVVDEADGRMVIIVE